MSWPNFSINPKAKAAVALAERGVEQLGPRGEEHVVGVEQEKYGARGMPRTDVARRRRTLVGCIGDQADRKPLVLVDDRAQIVQFLRIGVVVDDDELEPDPRARDHRLDRLAHERRIVVVGEDDRHLRYGPEIAGGIGDPRELLRAVFEGRNGGFDQPGVVDLGQQYVLYHRPALLLAGLRLVEERADLTLDRRYRRSALEAARASFDRAAERRGSCVAGAERSRVDRCGPTR